MIKLHFAYRLSLILTLTAWIAAPVREAAAQAAAKPAATNAAAVKPATKPAATNAAATAANPAAKKAKAEPKKPDGLRTWKAANGDTVEAFYESMEGNLVALKTPEGKIFKIPTTQLSRDDQQWILANKGPGTGAIYTPPSPSHLPSYADGKWKGNHAVYEHARFDALMDDRGHITVYPKENGKRVGKSLSYGLGCYYNNTLFTPARHTGRPIKEFHTPPKPQKQPKEVTFTGLLEDDVPFEVTFRFKDNKIEAKGWCKDPAKIRDRTKFRIGVSVPASHDLSRVKMSEREKILEGYELQLKPEKGNSTFYSYAKSLQGMGGTAKIVAIVGPLFGPRKVSIIAGDVKTAPLHPYIYPGYAPWQGYYIGLYKDEQDSKSNAETITLAVD